MITAVADTHVFIWYLAGDRRLSTVAKQYIDRIAANSDEIAISAITLVEIIYLAEKGRLVSDWPERATSLLDEPDSPFVVAIVDREVVKSLASLAGSGIIDMPDRIIAASALRYGVPLLTRDHVIANSPIETLW